MLYSIYYCALFGALNVVSNFDLSQAASAPPQLETKNNNTRRQELKNLSNSKKTLPLTTTQSVHPISVKQQQQQQRNTTIVRTTKAKDFARLTTPQRNERATTIKPKITTMKNSSTKRVVIAKTQKLTSTMLNLINSTKVTTKIAITKERSIKKSVETSTPTSTTKAMNNTLLAKRIKNPTANGSATIKPTMKATKSTTRTTWSTTTVKPMTLKMEQLNEVKKTKLDTKNNMKTTKKILLSTTRLTTTPKTTTELQTITSVRTTIIDRIKQACIFEGKTFAHASSWIYKSLFNITCNDGNVRVINCITPLGTKLPLGTHNFVEKNGFSYDCKLRTKVDAIASLVNDEKQSQLNETNGEEIDFVRECDEGASAYVRANFMVSCEHEEIMGCIDVAGDLVRTGYYVLSNGRLRICSIATDQRSATSQWKGCFNGTRDDDPELEKFHMQLGERWHNDDFVLQCGVQGFFVEKCRIKSETNKQQDIFVEAGSAWIDADNVFNICQ